MKIINKTKHGRIINISLQHHKEKKKTFENRGKINSLELDFQ